MSALRIGHGSAPGTCGELVQGVREDGSHFHVTFPIASSAHVRLTCTPAAAWSFTGPGAAKEKLRAAIGWTVARLGVHPHAVAVEHISGLPVGRGMASSTADVVAAARATAAAFGGTLTVDELAAAAVSIESSDGLMHPGVVAFEQRTGRLLDAYEWAPPLAAVIVLPAEQVATARVDFAGKEQHAPAFEQLLAQLRTAAETRDGAAFTAAGTRSAVLNQDYLPNPYLAALHDRQPRWGADGVVVAHTGSLAGLTYLLSGTAADRDRLRAGAEAVRDWLDTNPVPGSRSADVRVVRGL